jgi:hypothetical protein
MVIGRWSGRTRGSHGTTSTNAEQRVLAGGADRAKLDPGRLLRCWHVQPSDVVLLNTHVFPVSPFSCMRSTSRDDLYYWPFVRASARAAQVTVGRWRLVDKACSKAEGLDDEMSLDDSDGHAAMSAKRSAPFDHLTACRLRSAAAWCSFGSSL